MGPGGGELPAGRLPDDDDDGATELDAGVEIDVVSGRPSGAQEVEESRSAGGRPRSARECRGAQAFGD